MAEEIKAGDIVVLKSGGPKMTVAWVEEGDALCEWFDAKNESKTKRFSVEVLTKN